MVLRESGNLRLVFWLIINRIVVLFGENRQKRGRNGAFAVAKLMIRQSAEVIATE